MRRAIAVLGAGVLGVVSPYPDWLTAQSVDWRRAGGRRGRRRGARAATPAYDIYTIRGASVLAAARRLAAAEEAGHSALGPACRRSRR